MLVHLSSFFPPLLHSLQFREQLLVSPTREEEIQEEEKEAVCERFLVPCVALSCCSPSVCRVMLTMLCFLQRGVIGWGRQRQVGIATHFLAFPTYFEVSDMNIYIITTILPAAVSVISLYKPVQNCQWPQVGVSIERYAKLDQFITSWYSPRMVWPIHPTFGWTLVMSRRHTDNFEMAL